MKRWIVLFVALVAFLTAGALTFRNSHSVPFDALIWQGEVPLVWLLLAAFVLGVGVALLLIAPTLVAQHWRLWQMRRQLARVARTQLITEAQ